LSEPKAELGVVIIHGMGAPTKYFAQPLVDGINDLLGDDAPAVAFESCFWSPILQNGEDEVWRRLDASKTPMELGFARERIVGALGDPTGYLSGYERGGVPAMHRVHECFADALARVEQRLVDPASSPIVVLAHSLGTVVVTNYLWNLERAAGEVGKPESVAPHPGRAALRKTFGEGPAQELKTLAGLITFGCNIPLFLPPSPHYECARFPRPALPAKLKQGARWLNVYDPYDVLGYPLNNLWDVPNDTVITDIVMEVGPLLISKTPLSHNYYWSDVGFQNLVTEALRRVLAAARGA
jgi:hypothetical protein